MAFKGYTKIAGDWKDLNSHGFVKVSGAWREFVLDDLRQWYKVNGEWRTLQDDGPGELPPPSGPVPGYYILNSATQFISGSLGGNSYSTYNLGAYLGYITSVDALISVRSQGSGVWDITGRPTNTLYRSNINMGDYQGRTIYFNLGGTAASQFNSGSANGYNLPGLSGLAASSVFSNFRLRVLVS